MINKPMDRLWFAPDWPAPKHVTAYTTTRNLGYYSLIPELEDPLIAQEAQQHRASLRTKLNLPSDPCWLQQIHDTTVVQANPNVERPIADGSYTEAVDTVCIVTTADCLPILITDKHGTKVAAIHAGWRGLAKGILEKALLNFNQFAMSDLLVWLGPAIRPTAFEVGDEVREQFITVDPHAHVAFELNAAQRWMADLYLLAKQRLNACGVTAIYKSQYCTYQQADLFYSYRREKATKRLGMATLIYLANTK